MHTHDQQLRCSMCTTTNPHAPRTHCATTQLATNLGAGIAILIQTPRSWHAVCLVRGVVAYDATLLLSTDLEGALGKL